MNTYTTNQTPLGVELRVKRSHEMNTDGRLICLCPNLGTAQSLRGCIEGTEGECANDFDWRELKQG
jgi:hypothetical protein